MRDLEWRLAWITAREAKGSKMRFSRNWLQATQQKKCGGVGLADVCRVGADQQRQRGRKFIRVGETTVRDVPETARRHDMRFEMVSCTTICNPVLVHTAYGQSNRRILGELGILCIATTTAVPIFIIARAQVAHDVLLDIVNDPPVQMLHNVADIRPDAFGALLKYEASFQPQSTLVRVVVN